MKVTFSLKIPTCFFFTQTPCWIMEARDHQNAALWWHILPVCNHHPKCKSITQTSGNNTEPLWHRSSRNPLLSTVYFFLWLKCFLSSLSSSEAAIKLVQVVFHPSCDSSPIILLVPQFGADLFHPGLLIQCHYNSSSCVFFLYMLHHSLMPGFTNWPHVSLGWCER